MSKNNILVFLPFHKKKFVTFYILGLLSLVICLHSIPSLNEVMVQTDRNTHRQTNIAIYRLMRVRGPLGQK